MTLQNARRVTLVAATLLLSIAASGPAGAAVPVVRAASGGITAAPFPRILNYNGYSDPAQTPIFTRYGMIIAWDSLTSNGRQPIQALRALSPAPTILAYERAAQVDDSNQSVYGANAIYPGWWLLKAGSSLSGNIDSSQTSIPVASTAPFHSGDDVLVDSESMHVTGINSGGNTLTVQRGYYSTAASHSGGARIATHAYLDPGGPSGGHPWALNMSSLCPRNAQGQRWVDFLANWMATTIMPSGLWDGIYYDNTNDKLYDNTIDVNNDGSGDGGVVNGVNVWQQGIGDLFSETRASFPSALIMGTGPQFDQYQTTNGQDFYAPNTLSDPVQYGALLANYHYHMAASVAPQLSFINPATPSGPWSLPLMRYGLTTALLDNGAYTYDQGATQDGTPWWFDEYDNGAGSALSAAIGSGDTQLPVVHGTLFQPGDTVIVEGELMQVTGVSATTLNVTRGYNGTTAASHDAGAVVATPQQVRQGLGYLGQPLGPAYSPGITVPVPLANSSFDLGTLAPWTLQLGGSAQGTAALDTSTWVDGAASAAVTVTAVDGHDLDAKLSEAQFALSGGQTYTVGFWAKGSTQHMAHLLLCSHTTTPGCFGDAQVSVGPSWAQYSVNVTMPRSASDVQLQFGLGYATGTTWIDDVSVVIPGSPLLRRDFTAGTVLINPSLAPQTATLPPGYCHLQGDQNPTLNDGAPVSAVTIPAQDGLILRLCAAPPTATATPAAATVTATATPLAATATPLAPTATPTSNAPQPTATATATPLAPTVTATSTDPQPTVTPINTPAPATATNTPVAPMATATATGTPTAGAANAGTYAGTIAASGGSSSYTFTPGAGGPATAGSCAVSTGRMAILSLYNQAGTRLASGAARSFCNWVHATLSAGQTYTVKTVIWGGSGLYRSAWNVNGAPVVWHASGSLSSGASQTYSFPTLGAGPITLATCGPSGAIFDLYLTSAGGATLARSTAPSRCQSLSYTAGARGLFRLKETSLSGSGAWSGAIQTQ